jgi:superfamily II DNA or RNA helicase
MSFTGYQLLRYAGNAAFKRGHVYFARGHVSLLSDLPGEPKFLVEGSRPTPYRVSLKGIGGDIRDFQPSCSCPMGQACKHIVAAALYWLALPTTSGRPRAPGQSPSLSPEAALSQWWAQLPNARPDTGLQPSNYYLLYCLNPEGNIPRISLQKGYLNSDGTWTRMAPVSVDRAKWRYGLPAFAQVEDETILQLVTWSFSGWHELRGSDGALALRFMLKKHRLRLADSDTTLQEGPPRAAHWQWQEQAGGLLQLQARLDGVDAWQLLNIEPPMYLDVQRAQLGDIQTNLASAEFAHLMKLPALSADSLNEGAPMLRQRFRPEQLPLPQEPQVAHCDTPVPCLRLQVPSPAPSGIPSCELVFRYAHWEFGEALPDAHWDRTLLHHQGTHYTLTRDLGKERAHQEQLQAVGLHSQRDGSWRPAASAFADAMAAWAQILAEGLPRLEALGWQIEGFEPEAFRVSKGQVAFDVKDRAHQWFEVGVGLIVGGKKYDAGELITAWLEQGRPDECWIEQHDGDWLQVDTEPLRAIQGVLLDLFNPAKPSSRFVLPSFQAIAMAQHLELDERKAPVTRALLKQLEHFNGLEAVEAPASLQAQLRPYQLRGLEWLAFLHRFGFGGILADDMGLGKTLQTLAFIQRLKDQQALKKPALLLAPTSLMGNWVHEATRFAPQLRVTLIHGPAREAHFARINKSDLVITSYPLLQRDLDHYSKRRFSLLVMDEAQAIKNPLTKTAESVRQVPAAMRLCLTGTPMENHLGELWALMDAVLPGLLGGKKTFDQLYRKPIEQDTDSAAQQQLAARVASFMLRRTKQEVAKDLPPKTEILQYVELSVKQRAIYESVRVSMQARIRQLINTKGMARSHIEFLDALLKLRQACIDPRLVKLPKAQTITDGAKLAWLEEQVPALLEEGRKILIFSQFTEALALVEALLTRLRITYSKLTGQTRKRQAAIDQFQQGHTAVFLISLKAGGAGLNLTAADVVIHLDPWWNPAVENQATDRAHRLGQDKPVFVYKLVAQDSIEERIQVMQQQKQALADALFDETGTQRMPASKDELLALLS